MDIVGRKWGLMCVVDASLNTRACKLGVVVKGMTNNIGLCMKEVRDVSFKGASGGALFMYGLPGIKSVEQMDSPSTGSRNERSLEGMEIDHEGASVGERTERYSVGFSGWFASESSSSRVTSMRHRSQSM